MDVCPESQTWTKIIVSKMLDLESCKRTPIWWVHFVERRLKSSWSWIVTSIEPRTSQKVSQKKGLPNSRLLCREDVMLIKLLESWHLFRHCWGQWGNRENEPMESLAYRKTRAVSNGNGKYGSTGDEASCRGSKSKAKLRQYSCNIS